MWRICATLVSILICFPVRAKVYDWGQWGTWTSCSEPCGKGIETRHRNCFKTSSEVKESRRAVLARWCKGNSLAFRFCEVKECDSNQHGKSSVRPKVTYVDAYRIRAHQCTEFNKKTYNGKNINWKPYLNAKLDECKLYCLASGHKFYARLKNSVNDGTPCGKDYSNVCIKGKCQKRPRGCQTVEGPCLVDQGKKILGVFNNTKLDTGYNFVVTIQAGATNVTIEELTRSRSYLALKDHSSSTYHLNGRWMISLSKTFQLDNSRVTYKRDGSTRRGGELITIDGPLAKSLDVMVIYQREPSVIMFSYLINEEEYEKLRSQPRTEGQNVYFPESERGSQPAEQIQNDRLAPQRSTGESISFIAGQGQSPYPNKEGRVFGNPSVPRGQSQGYLHGQIKQDKQVTYGSSWVQFGGDEGHQQKETSQTSFQVARRPFLNQQIYKPNNFDTSTSMSYPRAHWGRRISEERFGSQTATGRRDREWSNQDVKKFYTSNQERNSGREEYVWKIIGFTPCSSSCAGGIQSGIVKCTHASTGENVQDSNCNFVTRPQETRRVCNLPPCPPRWAPQEWQVCSKSCGEGQQVRDLMCEQTIDRNGEKVTVMLPVVKCPVPLRPDVIRKCFIKECPELPRAKWVVENWGECSVECDHGVQKREIACKDYKNETVDESNCLGTRKPIVLKACYMGMCKADWYFRSAWSQCSRTCGGGYRSRPVVCARIEGSKLAETYCKKKKPEHEQTCNTQHCKGIWVTSEWSKCSTDCGRGIQQRVVLCMKSVNGNYQETFDSECSLDDKPAVRKDCSSNCPPSWFATPWTQCSVTCGHGVETRHASCLSDEGKQVGGCKAWERPQLRRACYPKACPGANPAKSKVPSTCKDNPPRSFKRYCHIIKRINYCRIPSYRKRCCATCAANGTVIGHM